MCFDVEAYLAGFIASDGHVSRKDCTIAIYVNNYSIATLLRSFLVEYSERKIGIRYRNGVYEVYVTDKKLAINLSIKYSIPVGNKASKIVLPDLKDECAIRSYIAGFFNGYGSIYRRKYKRRDGGISIYYEVKIKSKSIVFLEQVYLYLRQKGIQSRIKTYKNQTPYLTISKLKDVNLFFNLIPSLVKRLRDPPPHGAKSYNPGRTTSGEGARLERARR